MRQRRLLVAAIVVAFVGGGIGSSLELRSTSHFVATHPVTSAFAKDAATAAGGRPTGAPLSELRFIPEARFGIGIVLHNESSEPVTLTDVRAIFPRRSVLRQLGTGLRAFTFVCRTPSCAGPELMEPGAGYGVMRPSALQLAPGRAAAVQLNFQFMGCPDARHGSVQEVRRTEVTYRDAAGTIIRQRVGLTTSTLKIVTPHPCSG